MSTLFELLTEAEAARLLRLPKRKLQLLADQGLLAYVELPGGERRFSPGDLEQFIEAHRHAAAAAV